VAREEPAGLLDVLEIDHARNASRGNPPTPPAF
jgi:hypothetical protein